MIIASTGRSIIVITFIY